MSLVLWIEMQHSNLTKLLICRAAFYTTVMTLLYDISTSDFEGCLAITFFNSSHKCLGWVSMTTELAKRTSCPVIPSRAFTCHVIKMQFNYIWKVSYSSRILHAIQYCNTDCLFSLPKQHLSRINTDCWFVFYLSKKKYSWWVSQYFPF